MCQNHSLHLDFILCQNIYPPLKINYVFCLAMPVIQAYLVKATIKKTKSKPSRDYL